MVKIYIQKAEKPGEFHVIFWRFIVYDIDQGDENNLTLVETNRNIRELKEEEA